MYGRSKTKNKKFGPFNENDYLLLFTYLNACIFFIYIHINTFNFTIKLTFIEI